jgi:hypothetical protein
VARAETRAERAAGSATIDATHQPLFQQLFKNNPAFLNVLNPTSREPAIGPIQVPPVEIPPPPVMLSAFVIVPSMSSTGTQTGASLLARAVLDQAEFIDNRMQGLTIAVLGVAGAGKVRFQDNLITDCVGGIWFGGIDNANAIQGNDDEKQIQFFQSLFNVFVGGGAVAEALNVGIAYPLPNRQLNSRPTLPTQQFHLTGNHIDALPADGSASGCAVVLFLTINPVDSDTSLLLNSNELRNLGQTGKFFLGPFAPTAYLYSHSALIQGNLIQNLVEKAGEGQSIDSLAVSASEQAITGNLLKGRSNITNTRPDIQSDSKKFTGAPNQMDNWSFLNFDPSTPFRTS